MFRADATFLRFRGHPELAVQGVAATYTATQNPLSATWDQDSDTFTKPCWTSSVVLAIASVLILMPGSVSALTQPCT